MQTTRHNLKPLGPSPHAINHLPDKSHNAKHIKCVWRYGFYQVWQRVNQASAEAPANWGAAGVNCSSSVEPAKAVVDDSPPEITCVTVSK